MDIINRLHSAFKDCEYFEFGEDYVKFFDKETKKSFEIKVIEVGLPKKKKLETITAKEFKKLKLT